MEPIGYYLDCDDAVCIDCYKPDQWEGFEDWESPLPILEDEATDSPTHCVECETLIPQALTDDGRAYVIDAYRGIRLGDGGRKCIVRAWVLEYLSDDEDARRAVESWPTSDEWSPEGGR